MVCNHWQSQYQAGDESPQKAPAFKKLSPKKNTQTKRFNEAAKVCRDLAHSISLCPEEEKDHNIRELKKIHEAINNNTTISYDDTYVFGFKSPCKQPQGFVFSPKRKSNLKGEGHTSFKKFKPTFLFKNAPEENKVTEDWQMIINNKLSSLKLPELSSHDFQILTPEKQTSDLYLNDNHMLIVLKMMSIQSLKVRELN